MKGWDRQATAQPLDINSILKVNKISSKNVSRRESAKSQLIHLPKKNILDEKKINQEIDNKLSLSDIFDDMMESCITSPQYIAFESHMPLFFHSNRAIFWERRPNTNMFLSRTLKSEVSSSCSLIQQVITSNKPIIPDLIYDSDIILSFSLQSFDHQFFIPFRYQDGTICAIVQLSRHQNCYPFGPEEIKIADFIIKKFLIYGSPFFQKERIVSLASKVSQIGPLLQTVNQIKKSLETAFQCFSIDIWFMQLSDGGYFRFDTQLKDFIGVYKCSTGVVGYALRNTASGDTFTINSQKVGEVNHFSSQFDGDPSHPILISSCEFEGRIWCIALRGEKASGPYTKDDQSRLSTIVPFVARSLSFSGGFLRQNVSNEKKAADSKVDLLNVVSMMVKSFDLSKLMNLVKEKVTNSLKVETCRVLIVDHLNKELRSDFDERFGNFKKSPLESGFAGSTALNGQPIMSSKPEDDSRFNREVDTGKTSGNTRSILSVPAFNDDKTVTKAVIIASNKFDGEFNESDKSKLTTVATFFGIALKNAECYRSSFHFFSHLNQFLKKSNSDECTKENIEKVLQKVKEIINASRVSLFVVLQNDSSLIEYITVGEKSEVNFEYSTFSIENQKASTFLIENSNQNIICVPIFDDDNHSVLAVIELSCNSSEFNNEINSIESFLVIASFSLNKSFLKDVSKFEEEKLELQKITGKEENIDCYNLFDTPDSLICQTESNQLFDSIFIVQGNSEVDLFKFVFKCFDQYKLKQEFKIDNQRLYSFILNISKTYKEDSYYNWSHAVSCLLFCVFLLNKTKFDEKFNKIEILGLFVAAIGLNSGNENYYINIKEEDDEENEIIRSILLKQQSVIEINSCTQLIGILAKKTCNLFYSIEKVDLSALWELIIYLVLQADMSKHCMLINEYDIIHKDNSFSFDNTKHRKLHLALFLKCADFSDCVKRFEHFNSVKDSISDKFFIQGPIEKVGGMKFTNEEHKRKFVDRKNSLIGFFNFVALPLFEIICEYNKELLYIKDDFVSNIEKLDEAESKDGNDDDKPEKDQNENDNEDKNDNDC